METFAPGYLDELGLGFESLREINPGLIMASVTGFGQSGPRKHYKFCDLTISALGGQMYVTGSPSSSPLNLFGEQSYNTASLHAAVGILLGLRQRNKTGRGVRIDVSVQEAVASALDHVMVRYFYERVAPQRRGDRQWNDFSCILPGKDGFIQITPLMGWETLVELLDGEGLAADLKESAWRDDSYRLRNVDHIMDVLRRWTVRHAVDELFELGQLLRFPWAPVHSPQGILQSPQLRDREFFVPFHHRETGLTAPCPGAPYKFSRGAATEAQSLGQTTRHEKRIEAESVLAGVRVVDFSRVLAGPFATRILADFGAEVIKVQSAKTAAGAEDNNGAYFKAWNRNKRSMTLDMSHPEAGEIALKLISMSDVVVENFSPRVMSNWGLGYEKLREVKEDLIMLSMSGMGRTGPWKDFVAFGPTVQALGGLTYLTSYDEKPPVGAGYAHADVISGLYGAAAVIAALEDRDKTGLGVHIDLSEYEAVCTLIGPTLMAAAVNSGPIFPQGARDAHTPAGPQGCYRCLGEDRWIAIAAFDETQWLALCAASGHPEWASDQRFSTLAGRKENADDLDRLIGKWTSTAKAEELMEILQAAGTPAGVVQNAEDLAHDPQLRARDFWDYPEPSALGKILTDKSPVRMDGVPTGQRQAAPLLGSDNRYVYLDLLGFTEAEFEDGLKKGLIA